MPAPFYDQSRKTTRLYDETLIQRLAVGAASVQSNPIEAIEVMVCPSTRCFIRTGETPPAATAAGAIPLEAGEKFHLQLGITGRRISVIRDTTDGFLHIVPVA
jgi:hypothetical protein